MGRHSDDLLYGARNENSAPAVSWRKPKWDTIAVYVFGALVLILGAILFRSSQPDPTVPDAQTWSGRLEAIASIWDSADERLMSGCPTVDALERLLPELRGIHATERDYVGLTMGERC